MHASHTLHCSDTCDHCLYTRLHELKFYVFAVSISGDSTNSLSVKRNLSLLLSNAHLNSQHYKMVHIWTQIS